MCSRWGWESAERSKPHAESGVWRESPLDTCWSSWFGWRGLWLKDLTRSEPLGARKMKTPLFASISLTPPTPVQPPSEVELLCVHLKHTHVL